MIQIIIKVFIIVIIVFPSYSQSDTIIKKNELVEIKFDSLKSEIKILKDEIKVLKENVIENQISKKFFDSIVSSQWNIFSTILFVIIALFSILVAINIYQFLKNAYKDLPELKKHKENIDKELPLIWHSIEENRFNVNRALYFLFTEANNFERATIHALRSISFFTKINDWQGELLWINRARNGFSESNNDQRNQFLQNFLEEARDILNRIINIEHPEGNQNPIIARKLLNEINEA